MKALRETEGKNKERDSWSEIENREILSERDRDRHT